MHRKIDKIGIIGEVEITLIKKQITTDDFMEKVTIASELDVIALEKSLTRFEYFKNQQYGYNETRIFIINRYDYDNHELIKAGSNYYQVIRVYYTGEYIELYGESITINNEDFT